MSKIDYDKAYEFFKKKYGVNELIRNTPFNYFYDGIRYAFNLKESGEDKGKHYYFTSSSLGLTVENFYKTREEAEVGMQSATEVGKILGEMFIPEFSEIEEREGSIEENYSLLPNGEKITQSTATKWVEGLLKEE